MKSGAEQVGRDGGITREGGAAALVLIGPPGEADQRGDGRGEFIGCHVRPFVVGVEVDLREERLVECSPTAFAGPAVQLLRVAEQVEQVCQRVVAGPGVRSVVGELLRQAVTLVTDLTEPFGDLVLRPFRVADEVEEAVLLGAELGELSRDVRAEVSARGGRCVQRPVHAGGDAVPEVVDKRDGGVAVEDGRLDGGHGEVGKVAGVALAAEAEVVEVQRAGLALAAHDDESSTAALTPHGALEVVVVDTVAGASGAACVQRLCDPVEEFRGDQRVVPTLVFLAAMGDVAEVVAVPKQVAE